MGKDRGGKEKARGEVVLTEQPIPAETYSKEYFTSVCDGHEEFGKSMGKELPARLRKALGLANTRSGDFVLDVGCGRGELSIQSALKGAKAIGMDYSMEALKLAKKAVDANSLGGKVLLLQADAKNLPFREKIFSKIFLIDVLEHLQQWEIEKLMGEIKGVAAGNALAVIETSPNSFVSRPLYALGRLLGIERGWNVKVHVNEQNYFKLKSTLERNGFKARVWLEMVPLWFKAAAGGKKFSGVADALVKFLEIRAVRGFFELFPISIFFCTHIWCVAARKRV